MKIFIHIGLYKTGTTYLQKSLFKNISDSELIYNPSNIMESLSLALKDLYRYNNLESSVIKHHIESISKEVNVLSTKSNNKPLFISNEGLSQRFTENDYLLHCKLLKEIFPNAQIFIFLRYQIDYIVSCYKHSILMKKCSYALKYPAVLAINEFLGYKNKSIARRIFKDISDKSCTYQMKAESVRFDMLIKIYQIYFSSNNVHVFFYENLKYDARKEINKILALLEVNSIKDFPRNISNRSFSAFSVSLLLTRSTIFSWFRLDRIKIKPISSSRRKKYIEINKKQIQLYEDSSGISKIYKYITWRYNGHYFRIFCFKRFLKDFLDRLLYIDYKIIDSNTYNELENIFYQENCTLSALIPKVKMPDIYLRKPHENKDAS